MYREKRSCMKVFNVSRLPEAAEHCHGSDRRERGALSRGEHCCGFHECTTKEPDELWRKCGPDAYAKAAREAGSSYAVCVLGQPIATQQFSSRIDNRRVWVEQKRYVSNNTGHNPSHRWPSIWYMKIVAQFPWKRSSANSWGGGGGIEAFALERRSPSAKDHRSQLRRT